MFNRLLLRWYEAASGAAVVILPTALRNNLFFTFLLWDYFSAHSTVIDNLFGVEIGVMERLEICKLENCVEHII